MKLISIIVPVYNVENVLSRCIESILNQTYNNFELILVDDGSTDRSGIICDEYVKNDERIKVIHKANGGLSSARNSGLDVAIGDYIIFCDSDDYVNNDWLLSFSPYINKEMNNYIFGKKIRVNYSNKIKIEEDDINPKLGIEDFFQLQLKNITGFAWNVLYYSKILKEHNIRFSNDYIIEDLPFNLEYLKYVSYLNCTNYAGYNYVQYNIETLSRKYYPYMFRKWKEKYSMTIDFIKKYISREEQIELIQKVASSYVYHFLQSLNNTYDKRNKDSLLKKISYNIKVVNSDVFQECLKYGDTSNENQLYIKLLKNKHYLLAESLTILSKIKRKLKGN